MPNRDLAHEWTDEELERLERRIARVYREARNELNETVKAYFESFRKRDEEMKALIGTIQNGKEWTEQDYLQWRLNQIGRGKRFEALRDKIAERMTKANEVAISYVNDATPGIYSLNRNYAEYTIEKVAGNVGFTLWDESTVKRLLADEPDLMPNYPEAKAVKRGIDLDYGKKQIRASVTSGILQGNSVGKIANDLQSRIASMNRTSAVRAARTAVTGAQNAGRQDAYEKAVQMGIEMQKEWVSTLDGRTRHSHRRIDGEVVDYDKEFSNGCRYPGDPRGRPAEVYNCRCTQIAKVKNIRESAPVMRRARDLKTGRTVLIENMTYSQWKDLKTGQKYKLSIEGEETLYNRTLLNRAKDLVKDIVDQNDYAMYGFRAQVDDTETIGNAMKHTSRNFGGDFEGSENEFEDLNGVSSILFENTGLVTEYGGYEGRVLYLLGADDGRMGYDPGEEILTEPVVLAKMRVQNGELVLSEKIETEVSEVVQNAVQETIEVVEESSPFAGTKDQVEEYMRFKAEMEAKYGADSMWGEMDDNEYDKMERLERIAYKGS